MRPRDAFVALVVSLAAATGCTDGEPSGMLVTVQKQDTTGCFSALPGGDVMANALPLHDLCTTTPPNGPLAGGVDVVRLVIDYGDLQFASSTVVPSPTVSMTLDGVSTPFNATVVPLTTGSFTSFFTTLTAPPQTVTGMLFSVQGAPGFSRGPLGPYAVQAPLVTVEVQNAQTCTSGACLIAALGTASISVTAPGTVATPAMLTWTLNGVTQQQSATGSLTPQGMSHLVTGVIPVPVPFGGDNTRFQIAAQVGNAIGKSPVITLTAPVVAVAVQNEQSCSAGTCLTAAVGTVSVAVTAPGVATTPATLTWSLNGVTQPQSATGMLAPQGILNVVTGLITFPVPVAPDNTPFQIVAQVGNSIGTSHAITLQAPFIGMKLSGCPPNGVCTLKPSQNMLLVLSAPRLSEVTQAIVSTTEDGAPGLSSAVVSLNTMDVAKNTISGQLAIQAPSIPGTWTITGTVGGYSAQSIIATIAN